VFFLTDNGYALGEHRWETKSCPYEVCVRTPLFVRVPGSRGRTDLRLVSNVDLAPTIAAVAGASVGLRPDGDSLAPLLRGDAGALPEREGVLLEWVGDDEVPGWWAVHTRDFIWIELATGERELYDLTGALGPADPDQLRNRADDPAYARVRARLAALLGRLRSE